MQEFADVTERVPSRRAQHLPALVRVCTAAGELALAERLIDGTNLRLCRHACAHRTACATLAESRGEFDTTLDSYEEIATGVAGVRAHARARVCTPRRRPVRAPAKRSRAAEALRTARDVLASLGAPRLVAETDSGLAQDAAGMS